MKMKCMLKSTSILYNKHEEFEPPRSNEIWRDAPKQYESVCWCTFYRAKGTKSFWLKRYSISVLFFSGEVFVEILGHLVWAHTRFQKFLEISKSMCVSPCDMQSIFLAAQRQEVGAKFSPTWKVGRDVASVVYLIPSAGVHRRTGEQVSGTTHLCDPIWEMAN
jgi:hypothetical protein